MEQQREKDVVDVVIDFFLGALVGALVGLGIYFGLKQAVHLSSAYAIWIFLLAGIMIAGSLTALFKNRVRRKPKKESLLAPVGECLSLTSEVVLWIIFVLGCASLIALRFF